MSNTLNRARFHLAQFLDWVIHSGSRLKACCQSNSYTTTFRRPRIFTYSYSNLLLCSLTLIYFLVTFDVNSYWGIKKNSLYSFRNWTFLFVVFLEWTLAIVLIYAYRKRKKVKCQLWCLSETLLILIYLLLTLSGSVLIAPPGLVLLFAMCTIKLFGLCVVYNHSLELKSSRGYPTDQDGMKISYFASDAPHSTSTSNIPGRGNKMGITRRGTDQTSIASSGPPSRTSSSVHDEENGEGFERRTSFSPPPSQFNFFMDHNSNAKEPQYSEIMVEHGHSNANNIPLGDSAPPPNQRFQFQADEPNYNDDTFSTSFSKGNIVNSGLMCGGSSSINTDFVP